MFSQVGSVSSEGHNLPILEGFSNVLSKGFLLWQELQKITPISEMLWMASTNKRLGTV